jgi:digalactosyldiacylglycerol synthase
MRNHAPAGYLSSSLLAGVNRHVVQLNCHRVVKLSSALQVFAPMIECVDNIHGVREVYLREGERRRLAATTSKVVSRGNTKQRWVYFIGKLLWAKGFDHLLDLQSAFRERTGDFFEVDVYGSGPDECEIRRAFSGNDPDNGRITWSWCSRKNRWRPCLPVNFMGQADHSSLAGDEHSIFINPSLTEVLCTTTAEAIAMGKWAIIPKHPSNAFFEQFPNVLLYRNRREFVTNLQHTLLNDPPHISDKHASLLTWEAATTRFINSAAISRTDAMRNKVLCVKEIEEELTLKKKLDGMVESRSKSIFVQQ